MATVATVTKKSFTDTDIDLLNCETILPSDVEHYHLNSKLIGLRLKCQYERQGGIIVCSKCYRYLGKPKIKKIFTNNGEFVGTFNNISYINNQVCPGCGCKKSKLIDSHKTANMVGSFLIDGQYYRASARVHPLEHHVSKHKARLIIKHKILKRLTKIAKFWNCSPQICEPFLS